MIDLLIYGGHGDRMEAPKVCSDWPGHPLTFRKALRERKARSIPFDGRRAHASARVKELGEAGRGGASGWPRALLGLLGAAPVPEG